MYVGFEQKNGEFEDNKNQKDCKFRSHNHGFVESRSWKGKADKLELLITE